MLLETTEQHQKLNIFAADSAGTGLIAPTAMATSIIK
jgi:hypothetical protein